MLLVLVGKVDFVVSKAPTVVPSLLADDDSPPLLVEPSLTPEEELLSASVDTVIVVVTGFSVVLVKRVVGFWVTVPIVVKAMLTTL